ncbi:MAG: NAD(P)-dependent oxidoreductase [Proteobacteria bacterium]|nr:NAD(P)-dependent oxidoreductase [Pseudomonadota bacterium]
MEKRAIGILHPGEMGVSIAASAKNSGHDVYWISEGRRLQTRQRAEKVQLQEVETMAEVCRQCSVIVSVYPPHAPEAVADSVIGRSFQGLYLDANAISSQRSRRIGQKIEDAGAAEALGVREEMEQLCKQKFFGKMM